MGVEIHPNFYKEVHMKKRIFLLGLSLLFLASCNDNDYITDDTSNEYKTSEITSNSTQENTEPSSDNLTNKPISNNETSDVPSTTEPLQGNVEDGGVYTDDSDGEWEYLG